jgi:hypothetical protein
MARNKKTHKQYELELFEMEKEFFPIEEYQGSNTSILHECFEGHQWKAFPTNLLTKSAGCPACKGLVKKTTEVYKTELKNAGVLIEPIEEVINMSTPIKHKCINGHIWKAKPSHILHTKTNCPSCNNTWGFKPSQPAILYYVKLSNKNKT